MDNDLIMRRLLLAKEFYCHATERSLRVDAVNKMMAIHNFHISVEIVLKAILLKYDIRTEKTLNIDFESMMSEVDKGSPEKIPFRQEMRTLNQLRGLIQHQGIEPDKTSMEDYRVITRRFLESAYKTYFDIDFSDLSRISLVADNILRELLVFSQCLAKEGNGTEAAIRAIAAFQFASHSLANFLPNEGFKSSFFVAARLQHGGLDIEPITKGFQDVFLRIRKAEEFCAVLGSGIPLSSLKRFESLPIHLEFSIIGTPIVDTWAGVELDLKEVEWVIDFVVSCILLWQQQGLEPRVNESVIDAAKNFLLKD